MQLLYHKQSDCKIRIFVIHCAFSGKKFIIGFKIQHYIGRGQKGRESGCFEEKPVKINENTKGQHFF